MSKVKTTFEVSEDGKTGIIKNVPLAYVRISKPAEEYEGKRNYEVSAIVDEDIADEYKSAIPQSTVKGIKTADFESRMGFEAPNPDDKKQYQITPRISSTFGKTLNYTDKKTGEQVVYEKGSEVPYSFRSRPKVLAPTEDGGYEDITRAGYGVGNGSIGDVHVEIKQNTKGQAFAYLKGVIVTDLIKYEFENDDPFASVSYQDDSATSTPSASHEEVDLDDGSDAADPFEGCGEE
jgi:hypothetical protein